MVFYSEVWVHGDLFRQERYCLALGEEELAQLRLFCAQRKQKSLGQGVVRRLPPKLEGYTCEKVGDLPPYSIPEPSPSSTLCSLTSAEGPWGTSVEKWFQEQ